MTEWPHVTKDWWIAIEGNGEMREMDRQDGRGCRGIEPRTRSGCSRGCSGISARGYDRRWWITRVDVIGISYIRVFFEGCDETIDKVV
jgi:hypothetical protein